MLTTTGEPEHVHHAGGRERAELRARAAHARAEDHRQQQPHDAHRHVVHDKADEDVVLVVRFGVGELGFQLVRVLGAQRLVPLKRLLEISGASVQFRHVTGPFRQHGSLSELSDARSVPRMFILQRFIRPLRPHPLQPFVLRVSLRPRRLCVENLVHLFHVCRVPVNGCWVEEVEHEHHHTDEQDEELHGDLHQSVHEQPAACFTWCSSSEVALYLALVCAEVGELQEEATDQPAPERELLGRVPRGIDDLHLAQRTG